MPKSRRMRNRDLVTAFGADVFSCDDDVLFCKVCSKAFPKARTFTVKQHVGTALHKQAVSRREDRSAMVGRQQLLTSVADGIHRNRFSKELCEWFMVVDIPFHKLNHPLSKKFLESWTSERLESVKTLRQAYAPTVYEETLGRIREEIGGSPIWVSIDETTDCSGRYVANIVVGKLIEDKPSTNFLLACECLERTNASTIAQVFVKAMKLLWKDDVQYERVLLMATDAARYMVKAAKSLQVLFPRMVHVTCAAHGLHRVSEFVRNLFPKVDRLVASMKLTFVKAHSRLALFREHLSIPIPPKPIVTRWGTWISAVLYYHDHFDTLKDFVCNRLDSKDAAAIATAQELLKDDSVKTDLALISNYFACLPKTITALEEDSLSLVEAISLLQKVETSFTELPETLKCVQEKLSLVLGGNVGLVGLRSLDTNEQKHMKFAPIVSCSVERSFSRYKAIFRDNRASFQFDNLKTFVVVACNNLV